MRIVVDRSSEVRVLLFDNRSHRCGQGVRYVEAFATSRYAGWAWLAWRASPTLTSDAHRPTQKISVKRPSTAMSAKLPRVTGMCLPPGLARSCATMAGEEGELCGSRSSGA
jgi:hypothetical protein